MGEKEYALRIRKIGGMMDKVTLKGPDTNEEEYASRLEFEKTFSPSALEEVKNILKKLPANIQLNSVDNSDTKKKNYTHNILNPEKAMHDLGLVMVQRRMTKRQIFNIKDKSDDIILVEIAIDHVEYDLGKKQVGTFELEIEDKGQENLSLMKDIAKEIAGRFGNGLKEWKYSKLETGKEINKLQDEGNLDEYLDKDRNLNRDGVKRIESNIS